MQLEYVGIKTCNNCKVKRCKVNNGRGAIPFTNTCSKYTPGVRMHSAAMKQPLMNALHY